MRDISSALDSARSSKAARAVRALADCCLTMTFFFFGLEGLVGAPAGAVGAAGSPLIGSSVRSTISWSEGPRGDVAIRTALVVPRGYFTAVECGATAKTASPCRGLATQGSRFTACLFFVFQTEICGDRLEWGVLANPRPRVRRAAPSDHGEHLHRAASQLSTAADGPASRTGREPRG